MFDLKQCLVDVQTRTELYGINTHRVLTKHGIEPREWLLLDSSKAQETSFPSLGFPSFYNGKPLKHLQNTTTVKKSHGNRFKLPRMAGEERSHRMKATNGGDLHRKAKRIAGEG